MTIEMSSENFRELVAKDAPASKRPSKYGAVRCEWNGRKYPSKAEMDHARQLHGLVEAGMLSWVLEQVPITLGDTKYRMDFLTPTEHGVEAVDVKGFEKPKDKEVLRLWRKYGPFPLRIIRNGVTVRLVTGCDAKRAG